MPKSVRIGIKKDAYLCSNAGLLLFSLNVILQLDNIYLKVRTVLLLTVTIKLQCWLLLDLPSMLPPLKLLSSKTNNLHFAVKKDSFMHCSWSASAWILGDGKMQLSIVLLTIDSDAFFSVSFWH